MKIVKFYGMRRSGNHAILEWLLYNLNQSNRNSNISNTVIVRGDSAYLNEVNEIRPFRLMTCCNFIKNLEIKNLIITYEDESRFDHDIPDCLSGEVASTIILSRGLRSNAASRLKKQKDDMLVDDSFFQNWQSHYLSRTITYEDWLTSKSIRDSLSETLGVENLDKTDFVSSFGGGSSFIGEGLDSTINLLNRGKNFKFEDEVLKKIEKIEKNLDNLDK